MGYVGMQGGGGFRGGGGVFGAVGALYVKCKLKKRLPPEMGFE